MLAARPLCRAAGHHSLSASPAGSGVLGCTAAKNTQRVSLLFILAFGPISTP
jgi:hypothetical protein